MNWQDEIYDKHRGDELAPIFTGKYNIEAMENTEHLIGTLARIKGCGTDYEITNVIDLRVTMKDSRGIEVIANLSELNLDSGECVKCGNETLVKELEHNASYGSYEFQSICNSCAMKYDSMNDAFQQDRF